MVGLCAQHCDLLYHNVVCVCVFHPQPTLYPGSSKAAASSPTSAFASKKQVSATAQVA